MTLYITLFFFSTLTEHTDSTINALYKS